MADGAPFLKSFCVVLQHPTGSFYQFSTPGFVTYMQLTSVRLSHINTHMSTRTGCMCGCFAWCSKWSSQVLDYQPWSPAVSLTQVHAWACVFLCLRCGVYLDLHAQPCIAAICTYVVCVYKLIVSLRGLPVSPPELSWELHVMSATFSLATKLPIMDGQGSVTKEWTPARWRPRPTFHVSLAPPKSSFWPWCTLSACLLFLYNISLH